MRKVFVVFVMVILTVAACSKKEETVKLEKDSPAYNLAVELAKNVPQLDPEQNNLFITTDKFDLSAGELIQKMQEGFGNRMNQLKNMPAEQLKNIIKQNAKSIAEKKILVAEAQNENIVVTPQEVDSILQVQFKHAGGEEKFTEMLEKNGIDLAFVKNDIKQGTMIRKYLDKVLAQYMEITDDEVKAAMEGDKSATVRHILLMTQGKNDEEKQDIRKKMETILAEAKGGADFAELAKKYSQDPGSKDKGGLYDKFARGTMVKPFEDAAFNLPVGSISEIVETQYGFHILKIIERQKETRSFDEVKNELEQKTKRQKQNQAFQEHINKLKEEYKYKEVEF